MKILSFDVGIKNLAYCYLEYDNNTIDIIELKYSTILVLDFFSKKSPMINFTFLISSIFFFIYR